MKVFDHLPKAARVDFVTDSYHEHSIKAAERERRGTTDTFIVKGPLTRVPKEWKKFLQNDNNKENLLQLILSEWRKEQFAEKLKNRRVNFVF